ncbi:hypothetical protein [Streptomyces cellostaticus]|uniref:hypothetical protein n=1 Tax=Streptomyces cellostaticus TaxID=67285 RepID=UPI00131AB7F0|nr:hypothetical protein [Streptomyces cellostaticus]
MAKVDANQWVLTGVTLELHRLPGNRDLLREIPADSGVSFEEYMPWLELKEKFLSSMSDSSLQRVVQGDFLEYRNADAKVSAFVVDDDSERDEWPGQGDVWSIALGRGSVGMSHIFKYRLRSPLGGLAADLEADWVDPDADGEFYLQVDRKTYLTLPKGMHWRDASWLSFGLAVHASDLLSRHPEGLTVRVTSFTYSVTHFRSEMVALAMDGWVREVFDLPDRGLCVEFGEEKGDYNFRWGTYGDPFEDDLLR